MARSITPRRNVALPPVRASMPGQKTGGTQGHTSEGFMMAAEQPEVSERKAAGRALRDTILGLPETGMPGQSPPIYRSVPSRIHRAGVSALGKRGSYVLLPVLQDDSTWDWACSEVPDSPRARPYGLLAADRAAGGPAAISSALS